MAFLDHYPRLFSDLLEDLHERRLVGFQRKVALADLHLECSRGLTCRQAALRALRQRYASEEQARQEQTLYYKHAN